MRARALLTLALVQLGISLLATLLGPVAISDDDYARVVIAQNFVHAPKLDPTGTSWLPLPFYVTGTAMALFGTTLDVARQTQVLLALVSASLLYFGARRLGHGPWMAALAAGLAAALPSAARLSIATVPEYPAAACMAFGMLCLVRPADAGTSGRSAGSTRTDAWTERLRHLWAASAWSLSGAVALYCACASRYEAWPAAGVYAAVHAARALRAHAAPTRLGDWAAAALAAAFPLLWLLHGIVWHDDPLFFVARVSHYKAALGSGGEGSWDSWLGYPVAALRHEPGAALLLALGIGLAQTTAGSRQAVRRVAPVLACLGALLVVLVLGDVRGGAPTHHPERALLSFWLVAPAVGLYLLRQHVECIQDELARRGQSASMLRTPIPFALALCAFVTVGLRVQPGAFAQRGEEERLGLELRRTSGAVVLLTADYGYFAVQAASARPDRFVVVDRNDPRDADAQTSADDRIRTALSQTRAPWAVVPLGVVVPGYRMVQHGARLALLSADASRTAIAARR